MHVTNGGKKEYKLNHLLFMDDLKLYAKREEQTNTLVRTVYVFRTEIGIEFGIKKCGILTMKIGKIVRSQGIKLPDGEVTRLTEEITVITTART